MSFYREVGVDAAQLGDAVAQMARTYEPLGAYAADAHVTYLFARPDEVVALRSKREPNDDARAAATAELPLFDWDEREMRDDFGVALSAMPSPRASFVSDSGAPGALIAEGQGVSVIVVGPVHAGIIEPGRFTFSSGGETVIHLDAQLSYSRRGVERFFAGRDALDSARAIGRICGACSAARSFAYARALEQLAGTACDERSDWARVVCAELERLYNHIFDLASASAGAGYGHGQTHGLALKERVHRLCALATGHRLLFDAIVPGGVRGGILADAPEVRRLLAALRGDVDGYLETLFATRSLMSRFTGAGRVSANVARAFGAVGPARRASGSMLDMRCLVPYGAYRLEPPKAVQDTAGDVAARCRVKRAEIAESFRLLDIALAELGAHAPPAPQTLRVGLGTIVALCEGPRGSEAVCVETDRLGRLDRLHVISASYRNWPLVVRAMEGNIVPDFPLVNKSFNLCYACADR